MIKLEKDIVFLDLETTGIDVDKDRIVEIAFIKLKVDGTREKSYFLLNPQISIPKEASDIHGITHDNIKDCHTFSEKSETIFNFINGCDLGGFNSNKFDIPLLFNEFKRCGITLDTNVNLIDVSDLYRKIHSNKLTSIYKRLTGKELDGAHGAMSDIEATIVVFDILYYQLNDKLTVPELDLFTQNEGKFRYDLAGNMYINKEGIVCWNFGKHINESVIKYPNYYNWVLDNKFPEETKAKIRVLLNNR